MNKSLFVLILVFFISSLYSQTPSDTSINNLIHIPGYKTSVLGAIPEYVKRGEGEKSLILIPGWGFDASVFSDFINSNINNYKMYAITIPGFGKTSAPPMPDTTVSYGEQTWSKGVIEGILKLIEKEKINKPVIVGHFVLGTQIALRLAVDYPEKVGGVIILGGVAKFIGIMNGEVKDVPLNSLIKVADTYSAPVWFKHIDREFWNNGNYLQEVYSLDSAVGQYLWNQVAEIPIPVMVRYLCEYIASDLKAELGKIKCPVLVLRATFNENVLQNPINNYLTPQFINTWNDASKTNKLIKVVDVLNSATFVWKDMPDFVNEEIKSFIVQQKVAE
jgi:pimeloyl-ACP methyl ester carboxylesterase